MLRSSARVWTCRSMARRSNNGRFLPSVTWGALVAPLFLGGPIRKGASRPGSALRPRRPPSGRVALLRRVGGGQRVADAVEHSAELRANDRDRRDDHHRDERRDEAVLDGRGAILVAKKLANESHRLPPANQCAGGDSSDRPTDCYYYQFQIYSTAVDGGKAVALERPESLQFYFVNIVERFSPGWATSRSNFADWRPRRAGHLWRRRLRRRRMEGFHG